jgi:hypothetical protein
MPGLARKGIAVMATIKPLRSSPHRSQRLSRLTQRPRQSHPKTHGVPARCGETFTPKKQ